MALDKEHLERAYVLGAPNSSLAAFRAIVAYGGRITEYRCPCGYEYFVGDCGQPVQSTTCPDCKKPIGGANYKPVAGNVVLQSHQIQTGNFMHHILSQFLFVPTVAFLFFRKYQMIGS